MSLLFALFPVCIMASPLPSVVIVRLDSDLQCKSDLRTALDFNLTHTMTLSFHGISGLTVP